MDECNIIKFEVPTAEASDELADLGFIVCGTGQIEGWVSAVAQHFNKGITIIGNERNLGEIQKALEGKSMEEVVYVSALLVGPGALKALGACAIEEDGNIEDTISRVLEAGIKILSDNRPSA